MVQTCMPDYEFHTKLRNQNTLLTVPESGQPYMDIIMYVLPYTSLWPFMHVNVCYCIFISKDIND